jgi:hypothetical protein
VSAFAVAQGAATKPKSDPPPAHTAPKPAPTSGDDTVVGTCNAHKITWGQLVTKLDQESPATIQNSVSSIVASKATEAFYGSPPKDSFTITKAQAISLLREHPNQAISQQLELMLTQLAVDDEATKENVQPSQKEVDDKVAALLKSLRDSGRIPKSQTDAAFLATNHTTLDKVKANFRPQCQLLNLIHKDIIKQLGHSVGPDDMLQASHLLVKVIDLPPTATPEEKKKADAAALARIKEVEVEIKSKKKTFADDAKEISDDNMTKDKGGDLGIFIRGNSGFGKEFETAAFSAKLNELTDPVKSDAGYHIILVTKLGKDIPAADRTAFIDRYENGQIQTFLQRVVEKDNKVENKLASLVPQQPMGPAGFGGPGRPPQGRPRPQ